eukprot:TRINITY_DN9622_c0_g1_i1.p1 TRINITY_DN9622_c0_g1~~TRINITY_DN9622_c0_g1_i1.p1  ORF type:complete len:195 (+),score=61.94 TRINITY_DN9622_c0_g1_i1:35-586(+)
MCIRDRYYTFHVNKGNANILISLTPLGGGEPQLFVAKGTDSRPDWANHRWSGRSLLAEHLHITPKDFREDESMAGDYVIGVAGTGNCSFFLNVIFNDLQLFDVLPGIPYEFSLKKGTTMYLQYYNIYQEDFELNFLREVGTVSIAVNNRFSSEPFNSRLPTKDNADYYRDCLLYTSPSPRDQA